MPRSKSAPRNAPRESAGKAAHAARRPAAHSRSMTDRAYARLEEMIVTLQLAPGAAVSEAELASQIGMGRTPIREALHRLAREKLVQILPRRGVIVSPSAVVRQLPLAEVRRELERLIARTAARRADEAQRAAFADVASAFEAAARAGDETGFMRTDRAFNELCLAAARNEFAAGAMSLMHALSRRFWFIHYRQVADMPLAARLHASVARAIAAGKPAEAGRA